MRAATLLFVPNVSLHLELTENSQDSRVGEWVLEASLDLGDRRGSALPEHLHQLSFSLGEDDSHHNPLQLLLE